MTPALHFLDTWEAQGLAFRVSDGQVRWKPKAGLPDDALAQLRALKPELLGLLAERQAVEALDRYEERRAITEMDGGLEPLDAEALARGELLEGLALDADELGILQRDPWRAADLVKLAQLRAMTGGRVVPLPVEVEREADSKPIRREAA